MMWMVYAPGSRECVEIHPKLPDETGRGCVCKTKHALLERVLVCLFHKDRGESSMVVKATESHSPAILRCGETPRVLFTGCVRIHLPSNSLIATNHCHFWRSKGKEVEELLPDRGPKRQERSKQADPKMGLTRFRQIDSTKFEDSIAQASFWILSAKSGHGLGVA